MSENNNIPSSLWHYTSFEVLKSLLKIETPNDGQAFMTFWLSNPLQTNDRKEVRFFREYLGQGKVGQELDKKIDSIGAKIGQPFTLSLIHQRKSAPIEIPMWRMYGDNFKGVRLRFNFKELRDYCKSSNGLDLIQCQYLNKTQMNEVVSKLRKAVKDYPELDSLVNIYRESIIYKTIEWSYENEWRLVTWCNDILKIDSKPDGRLYLPLKIPLSSLKTIEIGPKSDTEAIKGCLKLIQQKMIARNINVDFDIKISKLNIGYV